METSRYKPRPSLTNLSNELLTGVLQFLNNDVIVKLFRVSRRFHDLIKRNVATLQHNDWNVLIYEEPTPEEVVLFKKGHSRSELSFPLEKPERLLDIDTTIANYSIYRSREESTSRSTTTFQVKDDMTLNLVKFLWRSLYFRPQRLIISGVATLPVPLVPPSVRELEFHSNKGLIGNTNICNALRNLPQITELYLNLIYLDASVFFSSQAVLRLNVLEMNDECSTYPDFHDDMLLQQRWRQCHITAAFFTLAGVTKLITEWKQEKREIQCLRFHLKNDINLKDLLLIDDLDASFQVDSAQLLVRRKDGQILQVTCCQHSIQQRPVNIIEFSMKL